MDGREPYRLGRAGEGGLACPDCPGSYALVCESKSGTELGRVVSMTPVWEQPGHLEGHLGETGV